MSKDGALTVYSSEHAAASRVTTPVLDQSNQPPAAQAKAAGKLLLERSCSWLPSRDSPASRSTREPSSACAAPLVLAAWAVPGGSPPLPLLVGLKAAAGFLGAALARGALLQGQQGRL